MKNFLTKIDPQKIKKIFQSIASDYDRANKAITLGMDTSWRKKLVQWSKTPPHAKVLDCATGTGMLAFEFYKQLGSRAQITAIDFCEAMLAQAKNKQQTTTKQQPINFQQGDIHKLPFKDNTFDTCSIAYGLRNVKNPTKALTEMARVTKKGGVVLILETGDQPIFFLYPFFYLYFRFIVPRIGGYITGKKSAYEYLQKSSRGFASRKSFIQFMKNTNCFNTCEYKTLFFGASFIYKGTTK